MYISRIVIRNFRNFSLMDLKLNKGVTTIIGENNTGKTNLLHALRLVVDANLSSQYRQLVEHDIHSAVEITTPQQVIISVEFSDYTDNDNEQALVGLWSVSEGVARLTYRFRPKKVIIDTFEAGETIEELTLEDYHWELTGGGDNDPVSVDWSQGLGTSIRFADLQHFKVVFLPALRDVQRDLRQSSVSPLSRLFSVSDISQEDKDELIEIIRTANKQVADRPTIKKTGDAIQASFSQSAGEAFDMSVRLGMADPSFTSISRAITLLLSNEALTDFEPNRNGLGLNNILYISMLLEFYKRRVADPKTSGQLLMIEEPEAHLHPQLQRVLYSVLSQELFQTIITTHSTHISSQAPLKSVLSFTNIGESATISTVPSQSPDLLDKDISDLERYLDATRSTLLYAKKVILVEGPAELFLIPALIKKVMGISLDDLGISVVPIYGVHFGVYAKLFTDQSLPKKCAIIADGDLSVGEDIPAGEDEDATPDVPDINSLSSEFVGVFRCTTTFERALTMKKTLLMLAQAAEECGAPRTAVKLREGYSSFNNGSLDTNGEKELMRDMRKTVLNTAKRFGKARFAQIAAKHVALAEGVPKYIKDAINWLIEA